MGGNVAKFYRALQKGNEVHAMAIYVSASKEMKNYDPNQFYGKCSHGNTPMHYAAKYAMKELLEKFLYIGSIRGDPEFPNLEGKNCFHLVCTRLPRNGGSSEQTLPGGGMGVNALINGTVSSVEAKRRADCLEILLNWKNPTDGSPPDLFMQDLQGNTALHVAVVSGLVDCVRLLRNAGAPLLFVENKDKKTACDLCEKQSHLTHIASFLESAMVFNCQQDSQVVCVAEISALRTEISDYERKGHGSANEPECEDDNEEENRTRVNNLRKKHNSSISSSICESSTSTVSMNGESLAPNRKEQQKQLQSCWTKCSFTLEQIARLRQTILEDTANELRISLDEAELLLMRSWWLKDLAVSTYTDMAEKLSVRGSVGQRSNSSSLPSPLPFPSSSSSSSYPYPYQYQYQCQSSTTSTCGSGLSGVTCGGSGVNQSQQSVCSGSRSVLVAPQPVSSSSSAAARHHHSHHQMTPSSSLNESSSSYSSLTEADQSRMKRRKDSSISSNSSSLIVSAEVHTHQHRDRDNRMNQRSNSPHFVVGDERKTNYQHNHNQIKNDGSQSMGDDCNFSLHEVSTNMMSSYKNTSGELSITCSKRDDSDLYPVTCEICLSPVDISDPCNSVVNLSCNHCTCYACWLDYMRVHVTKERKCTVECPVYQCEQILSSYKVEKLIRSQMDFESGGGDSSMSTVSVMQDVHNLIRLLEENRIERFVELYEGMKWCPNANCSLAVKLPKFLSRRPCVNYFYSLASDTTSPPSSKLTESVKRKTPTESSAETVTNNGPSLDSNSIRGNTGVSASSASKQTDSEAAICTSSTSSSTRKSSSGKEKRSGSKKKGVSKKEAELQVIPEDQISSVSVMCGNEHYFCWNCRNEGHQPASCDHWNMWFEKIEQVKPNQMGTKDIWESAEYAANYLWFFTQSKKCPKCSAPIQKIDGCNHMKCVAKGCRHEFCWICLTSWSKHGSATGGFWRCNRFQTSKDTTVAETQASEASQNPQTSADPAATGEVSDNSHLSTNSIPAISPAAKIVPHKSNSKSISSSDQQKKSKSVLTVSNSNQSNSSSRSTASENRLDPRERASSFLSSPSKASTGSSGKKKKVVNALATTRPTSSSSSSSVATPHVNSSSNGAAISSSGSRTTTATSNAAQNQSISNKDATARLNDLNKFLHYYSRFFNHRLSMKLELPLLDQARQKISSLLKCYESGPGDDAGAKMAVSKCDSFTGDDEESIERQKRLTFLETAIKELILTRKVLSASYVFAYYLSDCHHQNVRSLFEFIQNDLEETVENLAQIVNRQHLSAPWFLVEKAQLIVKKKRYELLDATTRGILPSDTSPIFKRKRKTFQGVQVCLDPLKMNMSERQAVMTSLYEMVVDGDGWLVDSTGCHNNIPMLYGHEDFYDLGMPQKGSHTMVNGSKSEAPGKVKKKDQIVNNAPTEFKPCAREACNRRVSVPGKLMNKKRSGVLGMLAKQKLSDPMMHMKGQYKNLFESKQNGAQIFCSLACMRREKLDSLENSGFTVTGQKSSTVSLSQSVNIKPCLDNEFPPVFLDNEKLDRKRREIVRKNFAKQDEEMIHGTSSEQNLKRAGLQKENEPMSLPASPHVGDKTFREQYKIDDSHLIQCCSSTAA